MIRKVQGHSPPHSEVEGILGYVRPVAARSRQLADHISKAHEKHGEQKVGQGHKFSKPTHNFVLSRLYHVAFFSFSIGQVKISKAGQESGGTTRQTHP